MKKFKDFDNFGVMLPVSYKNTMSVASMKNFFKIIRKMGYNQVYLYTEDKMEVNNEPYHGYMRGRYTKDDLKELDAYASSLGIELVPCVQTLAHLYSLSLWQGEYKMEGQQTLLVDDPRTYEYIDNLFATCRECFKTDMIHIGMDEAHELGRGQHLDKHGYESKISMMTRHLAKVNEIADKYGYKNPMIWSDMLFYGWNNDVYVVPKQEVPEEYRKALPENVIPVFWDYYHSEEHEYGDMFEMHKQISDKTWFVGAVWNWIGYMPNNYYSVKTMLPALDACKNHGIRNAFIALWNEEECSYYANLPSLLYIAEYARGNKDEANIKAKFEKMFGIGYDEFCRLDYVNFITDNWQYEQHARNCSEYMTYTDPFRGYLDYTVRRGGSVTFAEVRHDLEATAKKTRKYGYIFDVGAKLCALMEVKYELGLKSRDIYQSGDREALRSLADNEYAKLPSLYRDFRKAYEKQWLIENKPCGFEFYLVLLSGLEERAKYQRKRILDYLDGKTDKIEELEWELLPFDVKEQSAWYRPHHRSVSVR